MLILGGIVLSSAVRLLHQRESLLLLAVAAGPEIAAFVLAGIVSGTLARWASAVARDFAVSTVVGECLVVGSVFAVAVAVAASSRFLQGPSEASADLQCYQQPSSVVAAAAVAAVVGLHWML